MPFDGEHFDAPLPGLDHPLFAPHDDVELVGGEINDKLEFSALYSVSDHDFVTGKQPTYVQNNANKLRRSVQMAGRGIQLFGTSRWEDNLQTCLLYSAPPALLNTGTKDFTILTVFQTDAGGDTNHGTQFLTNIAAAGGSVTNREMAGLSFNTYNTFDRSLGAGVWDSSTGYSIAAPAGTCVHKRAQVALFTRCRGVMSLWAFGQRLASASNTATLAGTGSLCVGALKVVDGGSPWYGVTGYIHLCSWWSRGMPEAEAAERSANPFAQYRPVPLLVGWRKPGGATIAAAGLATETDSAFGLTWSKRRAAGLAAETDAALAATARRIQALGLTAESDAALAAAHGKSRAAGLAAESDTAPAVTARRSHAAGLAAETDTAPAAGHAKAATAGQAAESDAALPVSAGAGVPVGLAAETDTASAATAGRVRVVGIVSESDAAPAATAARRRLVGLAAETDTAPAIVAHRARAIGLAAEIDAALGATFGRAFGAGLAGESDSAPALSWRRAVTVATALETNTALALVIAAAGTAIPRSGGAVTIGGGSDGLASARTASAAAIARALGTPAVPR